MCHWLWRHLNPHPVGDAQSKRTQYGQFHSHNDVVRIFYFCAFCLANSVSKTEVSVCPYDNDSNESSTNFRVLAVRDKKLQWHLSANMYLSRDFK